MAWTLGLSSATAVVPVVCTTCISTRNAAVSSSTNQLWECQVLFTGRKDGDKVEDG